MELLEKMIGLVSPETQARRAAARHRLALIGRAHESSEAMFRKYEAASRGRRTKGWRASAGSADAQIGGAGAALRYRSRDLTNNAAHGNAALRKIEAALVGTGIRPCILPAGKSARAKRDAETMKRLWKEHAEKRHIDADGHDGIYGLQALVAREVAESGEVLIRRRFRQLADGLPLPLQIQILQVDHLDTARQGALEGGGKIVQGVEYDERGRRVAFWIFSTHPGDAEGTYERSKRVPAEELLHVYRKDRAGATRAVPWGSSAMVALKESDTYADAQILKQTIAGCFSAFVHDINGDQSGEEYSLSDRDAAGHPLEELEPGTIKHLPAGRSITTLDPPSVDGYRDFMDVHLHQVAAGMGVTYEAMTGDLRSVSYTSGRMGAQAFDAEMRAVRDRVLVVGFLDPLWEWLNTAAELAGEISAPVPCSWTPPRRAMLDPSREVKARLLEVRSGFMSLSQAIRESGADPDLVLEELSKDKEKLAELGLVLEADASAMATAGAPSPDGNPNRSHAAEIEALEGFAMKIQELQDSLGV